MIQFMTYNVFNADENYVRRDFDSLEELRNNYLSEDCDLPPLDDEVGYFEVAGVILYGMRKFSDIVYILGLDMID